MNPSEHVLFYHLAQDKQDRYTELMKRLGIPCTVVDPSFGENTLGSLLGYTGFPKPVSSPDAAFPGEMMIMAGFSSLRLDTLLASIRKAGLPPIPLKAMVTDTNIHWSLKTLFGHLLMEHMQMTGGQ